MSSKSPPGGSLDMDAMIDEVIAHKGPYQYTEGLHEDNWEKELEKIPLFMDKPLEEVDPEENLEAAAFQCIRQEDTPAGRAAEHREEGNEFFKRKKYKEAIAEYSEGIKQNCGDPVINAVLLCNRATAHFYLGNNRSSVNDANRSREIKPDHIKAYIRGAAACVQMESAGEAIEWCDSGLLVEPTNQKLQDLRKKAVTMKKKQDRDVRKGAAQEKKVLKEESLLLATIKSRGVCLLDNSLGASNLGDERCVHADSNGDLLWPILFLYPEHRYSDYVVAFNEHHSFRDHLCVMLADPPGWDVERRYNPRSVEVYCDVCTLCIIAGVL